MSLVTPHWVESGESLPFIPFPMHVGQWDMRFVTYFTTVHMNMHVWFSFWPTNPIPKSLGREKKGKGKVKKIVQTPTWTIQPQQLMHIIHHQNNQNNTPTYRYLLSHPPTQPKIYLPQSHFQSSKLIQIFKFQVTKNYICVIKKLN